MERLNSCAPNVYDAVVCLYGFNFTRAAKDSELQHMKRRSNQCIEKDSNAAAPRIQAAAFF
jgi:hypothetical protein